MITKICKCCKNELDINLFRISGKYYRPKCKACESKEAMQWAKDNKESKIEIDRKYHLNNKDFRNKSCRDYYFNNQSTEIYRASIKRSRKIDRTPKWLTESDICQIKCYYNLATRLTTCLGIEFHVDHIVPLSGKTISGLHIPSNLQVITASTNLRKSNKFVI